MKSANKVQEVLRSLTIVYPSTKCKVVQSADAHKFPQSLMYFESPSQHTEIMYIIHNILASQKAQQVRKTKRSYQLNEQEK